MADGLFGIPTGFRAYQDDQIQLQELALKRRQVDSSTALNEAQIAHYGSLNKTQQGTLALAQRKADDEALMQKELARIAQGGAPQEGTPTLPLAGGSSFDAEIATAQKQIRYLQSIGRGEEAAKMLPQLTGAVENLAQARQAASAARENEIEAETKRHEFTSRALSGARDEASYQAALLQLRGSNLYSPEDLAELPQRYNAGRVAGLIAGSAAAKQKADIAREASRAASQNATDADLRRHRKVTEEIAEKAHNLAVEREARLEATGAERFLADDKPLPAPTRAKLSMVEAELERSGVKVADKQGDALVANIAEQVEELVASTKLSRQAATARVVAEMEQRGELTRNALRRDSYTPKEGSVTMPLALPSSRDGLVPGHYYKDPASGNVKKFTGSGWEEVKRRKTRG